MRGGLGAFGALWARGFGGVRGGGVRGGKGRREFERGAARGTLFLLTGAAFFTSLTRARRFVVLAREGRGEGFERRGGERGSGGSFAFSGLALGDLALVLDRNLARASYDRLGDVLADHPRR